MNRTEARRTLYARESAISTNVDDYFAGRITREEFSRRQYADHDALAAAGQTDHFCRRWRAANPAL